MTIFSLPCTNRLIRGMSRGVIIGLPLICCSRSNGQIRELGKVILTEPPTNHMVASSVASMHLGDFLRDLSTGVFTSEEGSCCRRTTLSDLGGNGILLAGLDLKFPFTQRPREYAGRRKSARGGSDNGVNLGRKRPYLNRAWNRVSGKPYRQGCVEDRYM